MREKNEKAKRKKKKMKRGERKTIKETEKENKRDGLQGEILVIRLPVLSPHERSSRARATLLARKKKDRR